ncbi:MAG TPA: pentapeptide repeat-containing protein [Caulobacteraceae bacterium]
MLNLANLKPAPAGSELDQPAFEVFAREHERFLGGVGGRRAMLRFVNGVGLDGRSRLLNESDFTGADLSGGLFAGCHFEAASLQCADLSGCDLRAANLRRADLRGARLAGASLNGAMLDEADMRSAYIAIADPRVGVRLHSPQGSRASSDGAATDFSNCAMRGVRLRNANLKGANFGDAILDSADLAGAKLTDANFKGAVMTGMEIARLPLSEAQLTGCVVDPTTAALQRADVLCDMLSQAEVWAETGGRKGAPAVLDGEDLRPLGWRLRARMLTALSARNVCAVRADFSGSQLQGANFEGADLRGANFEGADLRGACFRGAKLSHASLCRADLRPLALPDGRMHFPDFSGAIMERTDLTLTVAAKPARQAEPQRAAG